MKKILLCLLFVLTFSLIACNCVMADLIDVNGIKYIDIGLYYGNSAKSYVTIDTGYGSGTVTATDVSDSIQYNSNGIISVDGKQYRGSIILKKDSNGLLTVINRVSLESYIASVISSEMSPSFNMEALKAQAVCARTYALKNINKHSSRGFSLCASTDCQSYGGIASESEKTNTAAKETAGVVMKYNGSVIEAVYSATSGGWTEDVKYVWGSDIPYLSAVEDKYESKDVYGSSWTKQITVEKATEIMNNKGYNLGAIQSIEVLESTERGVVTKLKVTGTDGEKIFTREGCRLAFGTVTLSQAFTVTPEYESVKSEPLYAYGGTKLNDNISVISANGVSKRSTDKLSVKGTNMHTYSINVSGPVNGFVFTGRGNGHLVGLSQNGANGMAAAGFTYEEILKHYYKGIELSWI